VDPRAGLDAVIKSKIPAPTGNPMPVVQLVAKSLYWIYLIKEFNISFFKMVYALPYKSLTTF
jgi:hypothetical protein